MFGRKAAAKLKQEQNDIIVSFTIGIILMQAAQEGERQRLRNANLDLRNQISALNGQIMTIMHDKKGK
jgi:hypothetical protein